MKVYSIMAKDPRKQVTLNHIISQFPYDQDDSSYTQPGTETLAIIYRLKKNIDHKSLNNDSHFFDSGIYVILTHISQAM